MIKVSVLMITYGHENYIKEAIEGVLMQKCDFDVELIIANDNSPDNTDELVKNYLAGKAIPSNIIIKYTKHDVNKGMNPNFQWAREQATGKYIAICEGDDYWNDSLKLQKQVDFLEENSDYSLCFHSAMLSFENNEKKNELFSTIENREYTGEEILKDWTIPTASVVFKTSSYAEITNTDFLYGDTVLFLTLAEKGKIFGMKDVMSVYRKHDGGITKSQAFSDDLLKKYINHHIAIKNSFGSKYHKIQNTVLSKAYISLAMRYLQKLNPIFLHYIFISFRYNPKLFISEIGLNFKRLISKL